jgi:hypothetical protein
VTYGTTAAGRDRSSRQGAPSTCASCSDDCIVIIEAKAQQAFDRRQLEAFEQDKTQLLEQTNVSQVRSLPWPRAGISHPMTHEQSSMAPG